MKKWADILFHSSFIPHNMFVSILFLGRRDRGGISARIFRRSVFRRLSRRLARQRAGIAALPPSKTVLSVLPVWRILVLTLKYVRKSHDVCSHGFFISGRHITEPRFDMEIGLCILEIVDMIVAIFAGQPLQVCTSLF